MKKKNFSNVEQVRKEIIRLHQEQPDVIVLLKQSDAAKLDEKERQTVVEFEKKGKRKQVKAIFYDGKLQYFKNENSKKRFLFLIDD